MVEFVRSEYTVLESEGEVEVCVVMNGSISESIAVTFTTIQGTAEGNF